MRAMFRIYSEIFVIGLGVKSNIDQWHCRVRTVVVWGEGDLSRADGSGGGAGQ